MARRYWSLYLTGIEACPSSCEFLLAKLKRVIQIEIFHRSGCVFSLVPLALIIAATVTLSNDAARSIAKFEALTTYAGSWVFDHAERGPDFCMLWAVVGVIG